MKLKVIKWNMVWPVLILFFLVAFIFKPQLKNRLSGVLMKIGFYKPVIPEIKPDEHYEPVPPVQLQDINHRVVNLQDQKGKVVFINFWATWCPPCRVELPSINALYQKEKNNPNVVFFTVDIDKDLPKSAQFLQTEGYQLPLYWAIGADKLYERGVPTTLVIDKKGDIVFSHFDRANYNSDQFVEFIEKLARQP